MLERSDQVGDSVLAGVRAQLFGLLRQVTYAPACEWNHREALLHWT